MNQSMKSISFDDAYGLGLIAKNPGRHDGIDIVRHLTGEAREIADAIITPGSASKEAQSAAQEWLDLAKNICSESQR